MKSIFSHIHSLQMLKQFSTKRLSLYPSCQRRIWWFHSISHVLPADLLLAYFNKSTTVSNFQHIELKCYVYYVQNYTSCSYVHSAMVEKNKLCQMLGLHNPPCTVNERPSYSALEWRLAFCYIMHWSTMHTADNREWWCHTCNKISLIHQLFNSTGEYL